MENKISYALVGFFVIAMSALLIATGLWLAFKTEEKQYDTYIVDMKESVSGLNINALVKYQGVQVGKVARIEFIPNQADVIRLYLDIADGTPLREDATAKLASQGLTGLAYIELEGGKSDKPLPVKKPFSEIRFKPSLLVRVDAGVSNLLEKADGLTADAEKLIANVITLSEQANKILGEENQQTFANTLKNVEVLSQVLAERKDTINASLINLEKVLKNTAQITADASSLAQDIHLALVSVQQLTQKLTKTVDNVNSMVDNNRTDVQKTTAALAQLSLQLNNDLKRASSELLPNVNLTLSELRNLINTLNAFSQDLKRQPNMMIFGKKPQTTAPGE